MDIILLEEISDKLALMESNLSNKLSKEISNSISNVNNVSNQLNALDKKYNDIYIRDFSNTYINTHFNNSTPNLSNNNISVNHVPKQVLKYFTEIKTKSINLPFREERKIENLYGNGYVDLVAKISYKTTLSSYSGSSFTAFYDRTVNCGIYINNQFYKTSSISYENYHYFTNIPIKKGDLISIVYSIDNIYQSSYNFANTSTFYFNDINIYYETYQSKSDFFAKKI